MHKSRKDKPMNAYVASIIRNGTPFTIGKVLYFERTVRSSKYINGVYTKVLSVQRVKAREVSS